MSDKEQKKFATVEAASTPGEAIQANISRAPNLRSKQDDHVTAFVILEQILHTTIKLSPEADCKNHITPVITALLKTAKQELDVLRAFGLIDPKTLLKKMQKLIAKIQPEVDLEKTFKDITDEELALTKAVAICEDFFKQKANSNNRNMLEFLELYSIIIPCQNLTKLIKDLKETLEEAKEKSTARAHELAKQAIAKFEVDIKELKGVSDLPSGTKLEITRQLVTAAFSGVQDAHTRTTVGEMVNTFASWLNKLPFVTFENIDGVSGKTRHGGASVASAMQQLTKNSDKLTPNETAIYIALLLDYYPLSIIKQTELQACRAAIIEGKTKTIQSKASLLAITRNNDLLIFSYIVARHWHLICDAFPNLNNNLEKKEAIKLLFVEHMLHRWQFADLSPSKNTPEYTNKTYPGGYLQEEEETLAKKMLARKIEEVTTAAKIAGKNDAYVAEAVANTVKAVDRGRWQYTGIDILQCKDVILKMIAKYEGYSLSNPPSPASFTLESVIEMLPSPKTPPSPPAAAAATSSPPKPLIPEKQRAELEVQLKKAQQEIERLRKQVLELQKPTANTTAPAPMELILPVSIVPPGPLSFSCGKTSDADTTPLNTKNLAPVGDFNPRPTKSPKPTSNSKFG